MGLSERMLAILAAQRETLAEDLSMDVVVIKARRRAVRVLNEKIKRTREEIADIDAVFKENNYEPAE